MEARDLLLIGGVSGSGKSVALTALEDAGYHVINNLPPSMLVDTAANLARGGQERVAIALDVKTGPGLPNLADAIARAKEMGWTVRFLFLDTKADTLVKRFSETRRRCIWNLRIAQRPRNAIVKRPSCILRESLRSRGSWHRAIHRNSWMKRSAFARRSSLGTPLMRMPYSTFF